MLIKYLIGPVVYDDFLDQKRIPALKSIKKALGLNWKLKAFYDFGKGQKAFVPDHLGASKKVD